jgi:hypothetical protein
VYVLRSYNKSLIRSWTRRTAPDWMVLMWKNFPALIHYVYTMMKREKNSRQQPGRRQNAICCCAISGISGITSRPVVIGEGPSFTTPWAPHCEVDVERRCGLHTHTQKPYTVLSLLSFLHLKRTAHWINVYESDPRRPDDYRVERSCSANLSTVTRVSAVVTFSEIADTHTHKKGN